jgi:hypothetical protein
LSDFTAAFRQQFQLREDPAVGADQIQAGHQDRGQRRAEKPLDLPLDVGVNALDPSSRLLFLLVVLDQQPGDGCAERRLASLKRQANLRARLLFLAAACQREHPIGCVPELCHRVHEVTALFRGTPRDGDLLFEPERVLQVGADAIELRDPCGERVAGVVVEHVAHRQRDGIEVVLNPQELQRVLPIAFGKVGLQRAQPRDLPADVPRRRDDRRQRHEQAQQKASRRRALSPGLTHGDGSIRQLDRGTSSPGPP